MIMPFDKAYKETKKIKQNISKIKEEFEPLAEWIDKKYGVKTLNIIYDYIDSDKSRPRLQVCLEYAKDVGKFMDNRTYNFDEIKQNDIIRKFDEIISDNEIKNKSNWLKNLFGLPYKIDNLYVYFSDFESIAKIEANEKISENEIKKLQSEINNKELWTISRAFSGVTFFLYTNEQLKKYRDSEIHEKWKNQYYQLLQAYDEFDYFKNDYFYFDLDSKENFDNNYEGSWFNYYR